MLLCHRRVAILGFVPSTAARQNRSTPILTAASGAVSAMLRHTAPSASTSSAGPRTGSKAPVGREDLPSWLLQGTKRLEQRALKDTAKQAAHGGGRTTAASKGSGSVAATVGARRPLDTAQPGAGSASVGSRLAARAERMLLGIGVAPKGGDVAAISAPVAAVSKAARAAALAAARNTAATQQQQQQQRPGYTAGGSSINSGSVYRQRQMDALLQRIEDGRAAEAESLHHHSSAKASSRLATSYTAKEGKLGTGGGGTNHAGGYRFGTTTSAAATTTATAANAGPVAAAAHGMDNAAERRVAAEREALLLRRRLAELAYTETQSAKPSAAAPVTHGKSGTTVKSSDAAGAAGHTKAGIVSDDELRNLLRLRRRRLSKKKLRRRAPEDHAAAAGTDTASVPSVAAAVAARRAVAMPLPQVLHNPKRLDAETERATRMAVRSLLRYHFAHEHYDAAQRSQRDRHERAALVASFAARQRAQAREMQQEAGSADAADQHEVTPPPFDTAYEPGTQIGAPGGGGPTF